MYADNNILFPHQAIIALKDQRGDAWLELVERVLKLPECHEETLALMLMMIRLNGCLSCEIDSYRAMRGCSACAIQTLRRFKGSDAELMELFGQALAEIRQFSLQQPHWPIERRSTETA